MEHFEVDQYELHFSTYKVPARTAAEAIKRVLDGEGEMIDGPDYIEVCDEAGVPLDDPKVADELRNLGILLEGSLIPSIRDVRKLSDDTSS